MSKGYYSLVQYCPNLERDETVNVGVILFCPEREYIDCLISAHNKRVWQFFGADDIPVVDRQLDAMKDAMQSRIRIEAAQFRSLADLEHFVATRGNNLILTPPRWAQVDNPATELQTLFDELVAPPVARYGGWPAGEMAEHTVRETEPGGEA